MVTIGIERPSINPPAVYSSQVYINRDLRVRGRFVIYIDAALVAIALYLRVLLVGEIAGGS
jgi:hypothetical protein